MARRKDYPFHKLRKSDLGVIYPLLILAIISCVIVGVLAFLPFALPIIYIFKSDKVSGLCQIKEKHKNGQDEENIDTSAKVAVDEDDESVIKGIAQLFATNADSDGTKEGIRGYVQNQAVALNNQPNIVLTYYQKPNNDLPIERYNPELLQKLNAARVLRAPAYLVSDEIKLSEGMIAYHFASIDELSSIIAGRMNEANLYLARAYDYALVQDFSNAIEDFSKAIFIDGQNALAYFSRANIRYKKLEFSVNNETEEIENETISEVMENKVLENKAIKNNSMMEIEPIILENGSV